jgi:hypothetical protein
MRILTAVLGMTPGEIQTAPIQGFCWNSRHVMAGINGLPATLCDSANFELTDFF